MDYVAGSGIFEIPRSAAKLAEVIPLRKRGDEPLDYLDIPSREQLEDVILGHEPTLVFVEHDECFVEQVATRPIALDREVSGCRIR